MEEAGISVVIPAHNEEPHLERVVEKIVGYDVDEVIIVDDGSTDRSSTIIRKLVKSNPEVKCLRIESNSGACGLPRQLGATAAGGEYVAFCDADLTNFDEVEYGRILEAARARKADLIIGDYTGKVGRITNFVARPMLQLFFPEIQINRVKTGQYCSSKELLEHFLKATRFPDWNSTISLLIYSFMNDYEVVEVDIGELHHVMKPDAELVVQAESAISLILAWAGYYGRTGVLGLMTPPEPRAADELLPLIEQIEKGGLRGSESLFDD